MRIRRAREEEAEALSGLALRSKAVWGYDEAFLELCRPVLSVDAAHVRTRPVFVAEEDGAVAGFCSLRDRGADLEMDLLFVEPSRIGSGIGRGLLEHAPYVAVRSGHRRLLVESDPYAESFYVRCGGRRIGTVPSEAEPGRELPLLEFAL